MIRIEQVVLIPTKVFLAEWLAEEIGTAHYLPFTLTEDHSWGQSEGFRSVPSPLPLLGVGHRIGGQDANGIVLSVLELELSHFLTVQGSIVWIEGFPWMVVNPFIGLWIPGLQFNGLNE